MLTGLSKINVEFSSVCKKKCWMCGRRERDLKYNTEYGHMEWSTIEKIANQVPSGLIIATHNNGESMESPYYGDAVKLFKSKGCFVYTVTNGQRVLEKSNEIIGNLDSLSFSIFENDDEQEQQYEIIEEFLKLKGHLSPMVTFRLIGAVDETPYNYLIGKYGQGLIVRRALHLPSGSMNYTKPVTIPEHGWCLDLMTTLAIDRFGDISCCVRFDPDGELVLGNIGWTSLEGVWNGQSRKEIVQKHIDGNRSELDYCGKKCHYYGVIVSS
jgi:hypothetical protein